jgi:hypothetical protein
MTITFHEQDALPGIRPYTIEVNSILGTVNEDSGALAVLMTLPDGEWQLTVSNHAEVYVGRITVKP